MSAQTLDRVLCCYRIGDPAGRFPIYSAEGSRRTPGRWNNSDTPMIYTSEHYSTAMLERLVHSNGMLPPNQHFITITIPSGLSYEVVTSETLPGWHEPDQRLARAFGAQWVRERRSVIMITPSVVARLENNILINPAHDQFGQIAHSLHTPVWWDRRLFMA